MSAITAPADVVARFDALDAAVAGLAELNHAALDPVIRLRALQRLVTAGRQQDVVLHDIVHSLAAEDPAHIGGPAYKVIADWCRISYTHARRHVRDAAQLAPRVTLTGQQLPPELPATAAAWRAGLLDPEHLRVIQTFIRDLPHDLPPAVVEQAETFLAHHATQLRPDQLDKAAKRAALYLNPDGKFSDHDRARQRAFTWKPQRTDGMSEGTLIATPELRANLDAWLAKFAAPGTDNLYRENLPAPLVSPGAEVPQTTVPVQVLIPGKDLFITPALQRYVGAIPATGRVVPIQGGHWVVTSRPDVIARLADEWIDQVVDGLPAGESQVRGGPREVRGKLALVTGAGAGIGRATALELARNGAAKVVIVDRDLAAADDTARAVRDAGAQSAVYQVDVTDEAAINDLAAQVRNDHGVVDILVNNAGIGMAGRFLETTSQHWDDIMAVNVRGVINGSRAFGAQMVERGEGGTIINMSSAAAFLPSKSMVAYSTTKAAVLGFSEALRADLADEGITVTAVCPGFVNTNIAKSTVYAGMSAEEQEQAREKADATYRRCNFTPEATAKAIVKSIRTGPAVLPVAAESRFGWAMRRISPSAIRLLARVDIRQK